MDNSTQATAGWIVFLAAMGMLFGLIAMDLIAIHDGWATVSTPRFVGAIFGHIAAVITAFVGGKLIPVERDSRIRSRVEDTPIVKVVKIDEIKVVKADGIDTDKE